MNARDEPASSRYDLTISDHFDEPGPFRSMYRSFWGFFCAFFGGLLLLILFGVLGWGGAVATTELKVIDLSLAVVFAAGLGTLLMGKRRSPGNPASVETSDTGITLEWMDGRRRDFPWSRESSLRIVEAGPATQRLASVNPRRIPKWSLRGRAGFDVPLTEEAARAIIREAARHGKDSVRRVWIKTDLPPSFLPQEHENVLFWEYPIMRPAKTPQEG